MFPQAAATCETFGALLASTCFLGGANSQVSSQVSGMGGNFVATLTSTDFFACGSRAVLPRVDALGENLITKIVSKCFLTSVD